MELLLLQSEGCAFCDTAEEIVQRLATEFDAEVVTMDLATADATALAQRAGVLFPPGILLDGELICYGRPSERRLRRELERRASIDTGGAS
ncbi:MAG: thioredoxin family protein [Actinomycetota bacterium]